MSRIVAIRLTSDSRSPEILAEVDEDAPGTAVAVTSGSVERSTERNDEQIPVPTRVGRGGGSLILGAQQDLATALDRLKPLGEQVVASMREINQPAEIVVEFGIKLNAAAGAIIASTSAEANITVKLTWKNGNGEATPPG